MKRALVAVAVILAAALVVLVAEPLFQDSGRTARGDADDMRVAARRRRPRAEAGPTAAPPPTARRC